MDSLSAACPDGCFVTPTLVAIEDTDSPLVQEEIFGPINCLERFYDETDVVRRTNATRYRLAQLARAPHRRGRDRWLW
ncbi:MAG: hypothetical protein ABS23_08700 [SAR92 bacterium BACL16 MAG-120619-bin48]|nr:MAG: hypothetical protein ABS23_08700 [SAR92 bacterium BACL16 MAG-120619-bin48]